MDDKLARDLNELRDGIDRIDDALLTLLSQRARLAKQVGELKQSAGSTPHVPERERFVIERLKERAAALAFPEWAVSAVFREIMSACLRLEAPITVSYLGPGSTFSLLALRKVFGESAQALAEKTLEDVFDSIESDRAEYCVVPIENSFEGTVHESMQRLVRTGTYVHGEYYLPIEHTIASSTHDLKRIRRVISHPQAFLQCRAWLRAHLPHAELVPSTSTAQACIEAAGDSQTAAIANVSAVAEARLAILARNIQDRGNNETRFLVLAREQKLKPRENDKTSIIFSVPHLSGRLYEVLATFGNQNVNILKLEAVPDRTSPWKSYFWMDTAAVLDTELREAIFSKAKVNCDLFRHIGTYPRLE